MLSEIRKVEYGYAEHPFMNEIALIASVFRKLNSMGMIFKTIEEQSRIEYFPAGDVLIASDLVHQVRLGWDGSQDLVKLFAVIDNIIGLYPQIIPWMQGFIEDGEPGEWKFFCLVRHALHLKFQ